MVSAKPGIAISIFEFCRQIGSGKMVSATISILRILLIQYQYQYLRQGGCNLDIDNGTEENEVERIGITGPNNV